MSTTRASSLTPLTGPVELTLHGKPVHTVFDLLGDKEDDLTYSVGWGLVRSEALTQALLGAAFDHELGQVLAIRLQETLAGTGRTDIEIETDCEHLIIEAKRGWVLPEEAQLRQYAKRLAAGGLNGCIAVVSECSAEFIAARDFPTQVDGVRVQHISWRNIAGLVRQTAATTRRHAERRLLLELERYLKGLMTMQNVTSNLVYVVSLGIKYLGESGLSFADIVVDRNRYFHGYGHGGWPKEPPNYLGFRYLGRLQQIRHVEDYEIVANPAADGIEGLMELQGNLDWNPGPHMLYKLGPVIAPSNVVRTGNLFRNQRVWAALDLLLTSGTIAEARDLTKQRLEAAGEA